MTFKEILKKAPNFIALDISVQSTGYIKCYSGVITYGTYTLQAVTDIERRKEFGDFLQWLIDDKEYGFIVIEDVIYGTNYKTTKILMQLNVVIEDLMLYGKIKQSPVHRINNLVWKKDLERISGYKKPVKGLNDKERVCECLKLLGLETETLKQDICDAFGIAIAWVVAIQEQTTNVKTVHKRLHTDLLHGYKIIQYATEAEMLTAAKNIVKRKKKQTDIIQITTDKKYKSLHKHFEAIVLEYGDDNIFCINYAVQSVGTLLLTRYVDMEHCGANLYICVYRK